MTRECGSTAAPEPADQYWLTRGWGTVTASGTYTNVPLNIAACKAENLSRSGLRELNK